MVLMAKKTIVTEEFTDDIDGSVAVGTVPFAYDGTNYEIDLSKKNKSALDKALKPYLSVARRVKATRGNRSRASNGRAGTRADIADIRAWAKSHGHAVSDRGRIPVSVIEAFDSSK
jgi:Lsr2